MRGKVIPRKNGKTIFGITPAHAGKSPLPTDTRKSGRDHPRTCGEKGFFAYIMKSSWGSPPHMRGKVVATIQFDDNEGITPAHAGKRSAYK